jgi:integrase
MKKIDEFLSFHDYSPNTADRYRRALELLIICYPDLAQLDPEQLHGWLASHGWGNSAQYVALCAVKSFIRWAFGLAHPALVLRIKRLDAGPQRSLKLAQVRQLLASFNTMSIRGVRDLALASLLLDSGLRAAEVCSLDLKHLDLAECRLAVLVKGRRWGEGVYSSFTQGYLYNWLAIREADAGIRTVFVSVGGKTPGRSLTRRGLGVIVSRWGLAAGVSPLSPHDLRRTFATISTRLGAPARVLQVAGRWTSMEMVERYTSSIEAADFSPYFPLSAVMGD